MCHISLLPDEILVKIFLGLESFSAYDCRTCVPLVCRRWWTAVYESRGKCARLDHPKSCTDHPRPFRDAPACGDTGVLFRQLTLFFHDEIPPINFASCVVWVQRHLASGCIRTPAHLVIYDQRERNDQHPTSQVHAVSFALLLGGRAHTSSR